MLDTLLVNAAAESGADVREAFTVDDLLVADDTVIGIRGYARGMKPIEERARIVIGVRRGQKPPIPSSASGIVPRSANGPTSNVIRRQMGGTPVTARR